MRYLILSWHSVVKYLSNISKLKYTVSKLLYLWRISVSLVIQHSNLFRRLSLSYKKSKLLITFTLPSKTSFLSFVLNAAHAYLIIILSRNRFVTTPKCYKVKPEPYRFYNPQYHFYHLTFSHNLKLYISGSWSITAGRCCPFTSRMIFLERYSYRLWCEQAFSQDISY